MSASEVDYEAELVVVIGRSGQHIPRKRALEHVGGYAVGHDVSARTGSSTSPPSSGWPARRSTRSPRSGPVLVTPDEVPDPQKLGIRLRLNGQTMQDSNTSQLIFGVDELIAYLSQIVHPGTGRPDLHRNPSRRGHGPQAAGLAQAGRRRRGRDRSTRYTPQFRRRQAEHNLICEIENWDSGKRPP